MKKTYYLNALKVGLQVKSVYSAIMIFLSLLLALLPALEIYLLNKLIDLVNELVPYQKIIMTLILYILLYYLLPQIVSNIKYIIKLSLNHHIDVSLQSSIMDKIGRIGLRHLESSDLPNKISHALNSGKSGLLDIYENIINMGAAVISLISICLLYKTAGIGVILISLCVTVWKEVVKKKIVDKDYNFSVNLEEKERYCGELKSILLERKNAPELYFYMVQEKLIREWREKKRELDKLKLKHNALKRKDEFVLQVLGQLRTMLSFAFIAALFAVNLITMTIMSSFIYAVFRIGGLCDSLIGQYSFLAANKHILAEINELLGFEEEIISPNTEIFSPPTIDFINVSYAYPNRDENALHDVSFTILPYQKVALVGKNGSGKSTLIRLLLGYDIPQSGKVLINGREAHLCSDELRRSATAMFQDYAKYELTFKDNIIASNYLEQENEQLLTNTIKWAKIEKIIVETKNGLDTDIIHGGTFSGGQWQKIAFARSKFKNGSLIILDEPNAAIDAEYEVEMYQQFVSLFTNATALVVSHRLPVCQICDTIIYLDGGKVLEAGSHRELLENTSGSYRALFRAQAELYQ